VTASNLLRIYNTELCTKVCFKSYGTALVKPRSSIVIAFAKD